MFEIAPYLPLIGKLGTIGVLLLFVGYLIHQNWSLQRQAENDRKCLEVWMKQSAANDAALSEIIKVGFATVLGRLD